MSLFQVGDMAKLKKGRNNDGQTPAYWDGAHVVVVHAYRESVPGHRWYKVRHAVLGVECEFREYEFDFRSIKRQANRSRDHE